MRLPVPGLSIELQPAEILLAMLVWGEARGESPEGRLAVAWVAKNRAVRRGWSLASVILQPWQFSAFNRDDPNRTKMLEPTKHDLPEVWDACAIAAQSVLAGLEPDTSNSADHYVRADLWANPTPAGHHVQWYHQIEVESGRTVETARIGRHVFARCA